jgi:preprotein translocase subunit SecD
MQTARQIVENRVNGLGVSEAVVQLAGDRRIVVELPGIEDPEQAVATIKGTALLEFVDLGSTPLPAGTVIQTDYNNPNPTTPTDTTAATSQVYNTVMTGAELSDAGVITDQLGRPAIGFELSSEGAQIFAEYTRNNVGKYLAIVLDNTIISAPVISTPITEGRGEISGNFTIEEANALAVQLRYGALPVPLAVVETRTIGPTLGQDSLQKSLFAGVIGLSIVMLFMALYYRFPGLIADLAILVYAIVTFALFRTLPVTLTLAGIAGLMLSTGSALDANILIFERMKEELRRNRTLRQAVDLGFRRAWPSIRDSNIATLITCAILFWFGSSFGATIVKGFALTLFIGVIVSLFTAIFVTRAVLNVVFEKFEPRNYVRWFGL